MRPGRGLKYREGWVPTRHTLPAKLNVGGKTPASADPKASSTAESGKEAPGRGSTTCEVKREREIKLLHHSPGERERESKNESERNRPVAVRVDMMHHDAEDVLFNRMHGRVGRVQGLVFMGI